MLTSKWGQKNKGKMTDLIKSYNSEYQQLNLTLVSIIKKASS